MSKIVECPVPRYAGNITIPDFPPMQICADWARAGRYSYALFDEVEIDGETKLKYKPSTVHMDFHILRVPVILEWVEKWELKNVPSKPTMKTFPTVPNPAAEKLYDWLVKLLSDEISATEEAEVPNA